MPRMNDLVPIGKKKGRPRPPGSTPASRVAILLEDIQAQVRLTMEAVTGFRAEFRTEINALRTELSQRIDVLEMAVRQNSQDIRQLSAEIRSMREQLERKADHEALLRLQSRVEVVERRLGIQ